MTSTCTCPSGHIIAQPSHGTVKYVPTTRAVNLVKRYTECVLQAYRYQINLPPNPTRELSFYIGYHRRTVPYWDPATTVSPFLPSQPGDPPADGIDVPQGLIITQEIADRWLWNDLCQLAQNLNNTFTYPLHQQQIDGLVSFLYSGGVVNSIMLAAINNIQQFSGSCTYTNPSPPPPTRTNNFVMFQWDPIWNVVDAEIRKYVYFRGNMIQSLVDRRWEESNLITGATIPYVIPGATNYSPSLNDAPFWGPCAVHQSNYDNVFGETSTGRPYWRGSMFPP